MIQINKLADYGMVILAHMGREDDRQWSARGLAQTLGLSIPMVAKILKLLLKAKILLSTQGPSGGYRLARDAKNISVLEILHALEEPLVLTACSGQDRSACKIEVSCATRSHWKLINNLIKEALTNLSLSEMASTQPHFAESFRSFSSNGPLPLQMKHGNKTKDVA